MLTSAEGSGYSLDIEENINFKKGKGNKGTAKSERIIPIFETSVKSEQEKRWGIFQRSLLSREEKVE